MKLRVLNICLAAFTVTITVTIVHSFHVPHISAKPCMHTTQTRAPGRPYLRLQTRASVQEETNTEGAEQAEERPEMVDCHDILADDSPDTCFRAGFVSIVGSPNVGKSTLMNRLVGERLSIVTSKAQTTRHRILGVVTGDNHQLVYTDTPGALNPSYKLQEGMMKFVKTAVADADVLLLVTDIFERDFPVQVLIDRLKRSKSPLVIAINKVDLLKGNGQGKPLSERALKEVGGSLDDVVARWREKFPDAKSILPISALQGIDTELLQEELVKQLPPSPNGEPLFPPDTLTDKPERFFASELIRERVFTSYGQEIPYSTEVIIETYRDEPDIVRINAKIVTIRDSQVGIIIGHRGEKLKKVGTEARKALEEMLGKKVFLSMRVKVDKNWRKNERSLKEFGYL